MNGIQSYRRLFIVSMVVYAFVLILLVITFFKPLTAQEPVHTLIGRTVTVYYGHAELNSYFNSSSTGIVVSIDDAWITLSVDGSSTITIPAGRVHKMNSAE